MSENIKKKVHPVAWADNIPHLKFMNNLQFPKVINKSIYENLDYNKKKAYLIEKKIFSNGNIIRDFINEIQI
jgi:hypothetical protein